MSMKIESYIDDMVKRVVRDAGTSGRVSVPKAWNDMVVMVCLLPEDEQQKVTEANDES